MYCLEYCDEPEHGVIYSAERQFDDTFQTEASQKLIGLDRFIYLADMFRIIEDCSHDFLSVDTKLSIQFWKINKFLLNYVNAVYSLKEYVNCYAPPLKKVTEKYYQSEDWYRFICDYRNRIIHQSAIIKDVSPKSGDVFVNLDELIQIQSHVISETKDNHKPNAERFKSVLEGLIASSKVIEGQHFLSMKSIIGNANTEISMMKEEVLEYAYEKGVLPILSWLLSLVYWKDGSEQYVFIVNKETGDCFEPNYAMESFILYMLTSLGHESCVCKKIHKLLEEKGYNYFFERCKSTNDVFTA